MKLAIMQPYFFPYIGYWQLICAADTFVLFDDVQYIRHGWVNRNRILDPKGGWQYITIPLAKHAHTELIRNITAHPDQDWQKKLISQLNHYKHKAPYFRKTAMLITDILADIEDYRICQINLVILQGISKALGIKRQFVVSSDCNFDYRQVTDAGEWALRISEQLGAKEYINPISGEKLFDASKFHASGIKLSFLRPNEIVYPRRGAFEPWLSIVDVLMFNGVENTKTTLENYEILSF